MEACKHCGNSNYSTIVIHTETTFGHGDSTHTCYVECKECGAESSKFDNYGLFNDITFRNAQKDWNEKNKL